MPAAPVKPVSPASAGPAIEAVMPATPPEVKAPTPPKTEAPRPVPAKELSTQQEVNKALEETADMLLQLRDKRIAIAALARQAGEGKMTPLGDEFRYDTIKNILNDEKIGETVKSPLNRLAMPEQPQTGAMEQFLAAHTDTFPPDAVSRIMLEVKGGRMTYGELATMMQQHAPVREPFYQALLGEGHKPLNTGKDLLAAANLDASKDNLRLLDETFDPNKLMHQGGGMDKTLVIGLVFLLGTTSMNMVLQDAPHQQQGGAGHGG